MMTCFQQNQDRKKQSYVVRRGNCSYVEMWILPLRDQGEIHTTQILHCIVRVWQPPAGGLIHPSSKRGTDRTRLFRAKVGECSREHS